MPPKRSPVRITVDDPRFAVWRERRRDREMLEDLLEPGIEVQTQRQRPQPPSLARLYAPWLVGACLVVLCLFVLAVLH